jgi:hypothetical protein
MTATLLKSGGLSRSEHVSDLGQNSRVVAHHVGCGEAEERDTGREEAILAAIVLDEARAMCLAVVLKA